MTICFYCDSTYYNNTNRVIVVNITSMEKALIFSVCIV